LVRRIKELTSYSPGRVIVWEKVLKGGLYWGAKGIGWFNLNFFGI